MRALFALVLIVLLSCAAAIGDEVFGDWMIFPGPNPEAADLLRDADPDAVFRIGQIIFDYPRNRVTEDDNPVHDLSQLQSVAEAVKAATPGPALKALVAQQLIVPHQFQFESATILDRGDAGLMWNVTYELSPRVGGSSGVPFQYRAVPDGRGNLIPPRLTVFDAYFHSPNGGWTCAVLQIPESPSAKEAILAAEEIRIRATRSLHDATTRGEVAKEAMKRLEYHSQKVIRIPVAAEATGKLIHMEIWAVNFRDPTRKERPAELFTVWVTADGRTADIQHLDHCWDADEPARAPEPGLQPSSDGQSPTPAR